MEITELYELKVMVGMLVERPRREGNEVWQHASPPLRNLHAKGNFASGGEVEAAKSSGPRKQDDSKENAAAPTKTQTWKEAEAPRNGWGTLFPKQRCEPTESAVLTQDKGSGVESAASRR